MAAPGLKLRAEDDEDLAIIAACLHCGLTSLGEMAYDREARRFAAILVRPLWETAPAKDDTQEDDEKPDPATLGRMRAGLHFDHVSAVRFRHLDRSDPTYTAPSRRHRFGIAVGAFCHYSLVRGRRRDFSRSR